MPLPAAKPVVKTVTIDLTEDGYPDWQAVLRINPPERVIEDLFSGEEERIKAAWIALVQEWNFVDDAGEPFPLPSVDFDRADLPTGLMRDLTRRYIEAFGVKTDAPKGSETNSATTS